MTFKRHWDRAADFLLPLVPFTLHLALHLPLLWRTRFFVYHDSLQLFQLFHITFTNLRLHGSLPEWAPYSNYGLPTYLKDVIGFSPLSYAVLALGASLGIADSWPLFLASVGAETLIFAFGFHAFCRLFLTRFSATLVASTAVLLTSPIWWNYQYQFRIVHLLPAVSWLIVKFFRTGRSSFLALSLGLMMLCGFGQPHYHLVLVLFYGTTFFIAFACAHRRQFRFRLDRGALIAVPLAASIITMTIYLFRTSIDNLVFVSPARDPNTLQVTLAEFLTYGAGGIVKLLELICAAPLDTPDVFFHVTTPAVVLAVYAIVRERSRDFLALAATFAVLLVFCFGPYSPIAIALYFIPGMSFVRHVGLMYAFPRLLLTLIAGFGADRFLTELSGSTQPQAAQAARVHVSFCAVMFAVAGALLLYVFAFRGIDLLLAGASLLALLGLAAAALFAPVRSMRLLVALLIVGDGAVYLAGFALTAQQRGGVDPSIGIVASHPFEERRPVQIADHPRVHLLLDLGGERGVRYADVSSALEIDSCTPVGRVEAYARSIGDLAHLRFGSVVSLQRIRTYQSARPDDYFFTALACDRAKLQRIVPVSEHPVDNADVFARALGRGAILLESPTGERLVARTGDRPPAATLKEQGIEISSHSANHVTIRVTDAGFPDGWLVYADAYHPGWNAFVEGVAVPVWRADVGVKAVRLPSGATTVEFRFGNPLRRFITWVIGLGGAGLIVAVVALALRDRARRG